MFWGINARMRSFSLVLVQKILLNKNRLLRRYVILLNTKISRLLRVAWLNAYNCSSNENFTSRNKYKCDKEKTNQQPFTSELKLKCGQVRRSTSNWTNDTIYYYRTLLLCFKMFNFSQLVPIYSNKLNYDHLKTSEWKWIFK